MFEECHIHSTGCKGIKKTVLSLNRNYPGHGLSVQTITDKIDVCPDCVKYRVDNPNTKIPTSVRVFDPIDIYNVISIDGIPINEDGLPDALGNTYIHIIKRQGTNKISLYPTPSKTDEWAVDSLIRDYATHVDNLTLALTLTLARLSSCSCSFCCCFL